jgi:hypothetical protein
LLGPPELTPTQVRNLIRCASLRAAGKRRTSSSPGGRHSKVYPAKDLIRLYESLFSLAEAQESA